MRQANNDEREIWRLFGKILQCEEQIRAVMRDISPVPSTLRPTNAKCNVCREIADCADSSIILRMGLNKIIRIIHTLLDLTNAENVTEITEHIYETPKSN